jgi:hypothetical protein
MGIETDFAGTGDDKKTVGKEAGTCKETRSGQEPCFPPVSFVTFVLSLAQSAMVLMGEAPEPESGKYMQNLPEAKHTIDLLAMLDCKTRGNLTDEERDVLSTLLCELRLVYVKKQ